MSSGEEGEIDEDGDGIPAWYEETFGLDDTDPSDALLDPDDDGLNNLQEFENGTDINDPDTDGDGMSDLYEVSVQGLDPRVDDAAGDLDKDGISNLDEYIDGSDPLDPDDPNPSDEGEKDLALFWLILGGFTTLIIVGLVILIMSFRHGRNLDHDDMSD